MDRTPRTAGGQSEAFWLRHYRYKPQPAEFPPVQWLIAQLVACGLSDKEIAFMLAVSCSTVKAHNRKSLHSLGFAMRGQLARYIFETDQFDPDGAERLLSMRHRQGDSAGH